MPHPLRLCEQRQEWQDRADGREFGERPRQRKCNDEVELAAAAWGEGPVQLAQPTPKTGLIVWRQVLNPCERREDD